MAGQNEIIHAIKGAYNGTFSTPGRSDDGSDFPGSNIKINIFYRPEMSVIDRNISGGNGCLLIVG